MAPGTFSNAMVATVGAYAEVVAEQQRCIEQLEVALRTAAATVKAEPKKSIAVERELIDAVRALMHRFGNGGSEMRVSMELRDLLGDVERRLADYEAA